MNSEILALTDDLTPNQFQMLLNYLWLHKCSVNARVIRVWRKTNNLSVD